MQLLRPIEAHSDALCATLSHLSRIECERPDTYGTNFNKCVCVRMRLHLFLLSSRWHILSAVFCSWMWAGRYLFYHKQFYYCYCDRRILVPQSMCSLCSCMTRFAAEISIDEKSFSPWRYCPFYCQFSQSKHSVTVIVQRYSVIGQLNDIRQLNEWIVIDLWFLIARRKLRISNQWKKKFIVFSPHQKLNI